MKTIFAQAINSLTDRQQRIIRGVFYDHRVHSEIAKELNLTRQEFRTEYQHALLALKDNRGVQEYLLDLRIAK